MKPRKEADDRPSSSVEISAVSFQGLTIATADGRPARLAVVDDEGRVIEAGASISDAVWQVAIRSYREFLKGSGHLRVLAKPH
ncbi:hypothetical protein Bcep22_gp07 [Burkholderia phage Bcep22]|uniref:Uncharacterized protein n=1 Tax=Burkholderia phage Bcep22 TaxID=2883944 RepID=A8YQQ5_9CAUD|nr:hypothetical protein Bcep22_gp07 [Burkholderia phage Bcep22]ABW74908.1 hypothetical protein Bcep22_gp07 [Burkholderia phage Bcep22]